MAKRSLNELEAAVMVIIVGNHKERLKLAAKAIDDNLIDPGKVLRSPISNAFGRLYDRLELVRKQD